MVEIEKAALARLEREGRLVNAVLKGQTTEPGRLGFRGDIALKFQTQVADEKRPPDFCIEQVLTYAQENEKTLRILAGYLHNFAYLETAAEALGDALSPAGVYFMFCNNIDLLSKFRVKIDEITFYGFPCDESAV
jgi:hypothetical protein